MYDRSFLRALTAGTLFGAAVSGVLLMLHPHHRITPSLRWEAAHIPSWPDSLGAWLLVAAVIGMVGLWRRRRWALTLGLAAAGIQMTIRGAGFVSGAANEGSLSAVGSSMTLAGIFLALAVAAWMDARWSR